MQTQSPDPGMRHVLLESCCCEPHWNAQEQAPGEASHRFQCGVVQSIQNKHQQSPVDHCRAVQACRESALMFTPAFPLYNGGADKEQGPRGPTNALYS